MFRRKGHIPRGSFVTDEFDGQRRLCSWVICRACGKRFIRPISRNRPYTACSIACRGVLGRTRKERVCPVCGKRFSVKPYHLGVISGKPCCSRRCRNSGQRIDSGFDVYRPKPYGKAEGRVEVARIRRGWAETPRCVSCGISFRPVLTLHHIDGDERNNFRPNLEWVCWLHHMARHMLFKDGGWRYCSSFLTPREDISKVEALIEASKSGAIVQLEGH